MKLYRSVLVLAALGVLGACSKAEVVLPGERVALRAALNGPVAPASDAATVSQNIRLPAQVNHSAWPQAFGGPTHKITHPALGNSLTRAWSAPIGSGNDRKHRITADPVAANGRIYTLDARSTVTATATSGARLWQVDLTPLGENTDDASGGGLAVAGGQLYVTTGFGDLIALDAKTGARSWTQRLGAPAAGSPAVVGNLVYVVSRDNRGWAIDAANGRVKWNVSGAPSVAGVAGGAGPAVTDTMAVFPFGTGEMLGVFRKGGLRLWSASVSGQRRGNAYASIGDITADPVIDGDVIYAASPSGRLVAVSLSTGKRIWTAREGAYGAVWPVGGSLFLMSDQDRLVRIDSATGKTIWSKALPYYVNGRLKRRKAIYSHFGPVLAGGRLLVVSDDNLIRSFSPQDGSLVSSRPLGAAAAANPIVVDRTLYVVTKDGQLQAFR